MKFELHTLDIYIIFCLVVLLVYTVVSLAIFKNGGAEPNTLTTCVFSAFGGEFLTCGLIKIFKLKEKEEDSDGDKRTVG